MVEAQRRTLPPMMGQSPVQAEVPVQNGQREQSWNLGELAAAMRTAHAARKVRDKLGTNLPALGLRQDQ
jgi:hypothetical protein